MWTVGNRYSQGPGLPEGFYFLHPSAVCPTDVNEFRYLTWGYRHGQRVATSVPEQHWKLTCNISKNKLLKK